MLLNFKIQKKV